MRITKGRRIRWTLCFLLAVAFQGIFFSGAAGAIVEKPGFSLDVSPSSRVVGPGETVSYTVSVTFFHVKTVKLIVAIPQGTKASFDENPLGWPPEGNRATTELNITTSQKIQPGEYTLIVTGMAEGGEIPPQSKRITLVVRKSECPPFSVRISANPSGGPPPLTVHFTSKIEETGPSEAKGVKASEGEYDYRWSFGDGATSKEANPVHTYEKAGTYPVVLTVYNRCEEKAVDKTTVTVSAEPPPPFEGTLTKEFSPDTVLPGEETEVILVVRNTSKEDFTDVVVEDSLPKALKVLWTKGGVTPSRSGNRLTWRIGRIARGETLTLVVHCQVFPATRHGKVANTAYLSHATLTRPIASNTAYLRIGFPDVKIEKSVSLHEAKPGDRLTYTLTIRNRSRVTITGLEVNDTLSDWLEFMSQDSPYAFEKDGRQLIWRGSIAANTVKEIKIAARIRWTAPYGTRISNQAFLSSDMGGIRKHSETVWTTIAATHVTTSKISFRKKAEIPQVDVGKILRFRLTIRNGSGYPLLSPAIDDYLPQGFSYVKGSSVFNGRHIRDPRGRQHLHWTLPVIAPGETAILKYQTVIGTAARRGKNVNRAILSVTDNTGKTYRLEARALINVSALSFTFYCSVEGHVYVDVNRDGDFSPGDKPLEGVEVVLSKGEKAVTDKEGYFIFDELYPGEYLVGINTVKLPGKYTVISPTPLPIILMDGLTDTAEFLVGLKRTPLAKLSGFVFFDRNRNGTYDEGEPVPEKFQVTLDKTIRTMGEKGRFYFSRLKPGRHALQILSGDQKKTIQADVKLPRTEIRIPIAYHRLTITIQKGRK